VKRKAALVPWYHHPMKRCEARTAKSEQCLYSARFETRDGQAPVCKIHADMLALEGYAIRRIRPKVIDLNRPLLKSA
jgi:hypothetical protein